MNQRLSVSDIVSRLVAYLLPVTYFLVTVSFYLKTYDSAQIKITLTQIGCSLVAVLWVVQLLLERRAPFARGDWPVAAPLLAVLASGLFSWAHSFFPGGSFDEGLRRVLYSFMGLVAFSEFRGMDRFRRLQRWLLAAFGVVVFYGFMQYLDTRLFPPGPGLGVDPFIWRQAFAARVFSSFGNPNFYGNFLVLTTPILLSIFLKNGGQAFRPFLLMPVVVGIVVLADMLCLGYFGGLSGSMRLPAEVLLALLAAGAAALIFWRTPTGAAAGMLLFFGVMFLNLYATETKGAWVGFLGAIVGMSILTGLFLVGKDARRLTRRILGAAAVTVILGGGVVGYYARQRIQSVSFRVFTWISTWEMIRASPVIGSGVGTFKWIYPAYRRPEIILLEAKSNTETDHAEEEYLEIWSDEGALGFGLFLWMVITMSAVGLGALKALTRDGIAEEARDRVYSLAGYLGAWWAGLSHWFMDVSIRFVSSGIYSLLLPALVAGLSRPESPQERQDAPSPIDRWIRVAVAVFWTGVFLALPRYYRATPLIPQLWPALVLGGLLWGVGEVLEFRLAPEGAPAAPPAPARRPAWWSWAAAGALYLGWAFCTAGPFRDYFQGDLEHNVAIFFSKMGVWSKGPEFDRAEADAPPEMQEEYRRLGGALEHYQEVVRLNPYFPMAVYFIGNVYSDWGSVYYSRYQQDRNAGDEVHAQASLAEARRDWDEAEKAYDRVKAFAPNYVQTHHQMGTLFLKRMEAEAALGDKDKARALGDAALKNFELYRRLDPVFPPNYYRIAQIQMGRREWDKAEAAYRDALSYNRANVVGRVYPERNIETEIYLGRFLFGRFDEESRHGAFSPAAPLFHRVEEAYVGALSAYDALGQSEDYRRFALDAHKGLGLLYLRAGDKVRAAEHWSWVGRVNPQDPDFKAVTGRR